MLVMSILLVLMSFSLDWTVFELAKICRAGFLGLVWRLDDFVWSLL